MNKKRVVSFLMILCFAIASPARAEDDWQYWNLFQVKAKLSDEFTWSIFSEQWLSEDFSHFFLTNVDTGVTWKPGQYFSLGGFYRFQSVTPDNVDSTREHRFYPAITFYLPLEHVKISDRTRFEYHNTNRSDFWWFRNKLEISVPTKIGKLPVTPFINDEVFYHTRIGSINENRAGVGLSFKLHEHLNLSVYYQVRHTRKRSDWQSTQVLGTAWTFLI